MADNGEVKAELVKLGTALGKVLVALTEQTKAFREQGERVNQLLDLRADVRRQREAQAEHDRDQDERIRELEDANLKLQTQIGWLSKIFTPVVGALSVAVAVALWTAITGNR